MYSLLQDIRLGLRTLAKNPGFAVVAVITLALGIGANTGLFSVINALLVRSLSLEDVDRLVLVGMTNRRAAPDLQAVTYPDFFDWRAQSRVFEHLSAFCGAYHNLHTDAGPQRVEGGSVSANFFDLLRAKAALGRTFRPGEDEAGATLVAIISDSLWRRNFGADAGALGQALLLDGEPFEVVGVLPPGFRFPIRPESGGPVTALAPEVWTKTAAHAEWFGARDFAPISTIARLAPGVTVAQAGVQLDDIAGRLEAEYPATNTNRGALVVPLRERTVANVRPAVMLLPAAVGIVLLIACATVANLFLVHNEERKRDFAVRAALGAGPGAVFRQVLVEGAAVALTGGALGLLAASWSMDALVALLPGNLPGRDQVCLDVRVLIFTGAAALIVGGLCGFMPAWQACRSDPAAAMKNGPSVTTNRAGSRLRSAFVVAEVTMTLLLSAFSAGALVLAAVGLYGTMSHTVSQRTHEIGVRIALGARARDVIGLVLNRYAVLVLIGTIGGVGLALALGRLFESLMFGVSPMDPATFVLVGAAMIAVAFLASYRPARRATKSDPMTALRCE